MFTFLEPTSLKTIPDKYANEIFTYNQRIEDIIAPYHIFRMVTYLKEESILRYFPIPRSLYPDVTPYLTYMTKEEIQYETNKSHSGFHINFDKAKDFLSGNNSWAWDFDDVYIPKNMKLTDENKKLYVKKLSEAKLSYIKSIQPDAKLYVEDYDNYNWWKKFLRISGTVLLSLVTIFISLRRIRKKGKTPIGTIHSK